MHIPTIDIGDRQKGRFFANSVIHCEPEEEMVVRAMQRVDEPEFKKLVREVKNPFGDGNTSQKIVEILKKEVKRISVKKNFYDIKFEEQD